MTPSELISEGSSLMLFGMGFVFLFLTLLVLVTGLMSGIINRFFQEPAPATSHRTHLSSESRSGLSPGSEQDSELVAVISAAIQMHRNRNINRKQKDDH